MRTLYEAAQAACQQIGVIYQHTPIDGAFQTLDVEGKATRNGAGRIRLYPDGEGGQVWNHVTTETLQFWVKDYKTYSPAEQEERRKRAQAEREKTEVLVAKERAASAKVPLSVWQKSQPPYDNQYLLRKQVEPTDTIREMALDALVKMIGYHPAAKGKSFTGERVLIIPVSAGNGLTTIEMIDETGLKAGLSGGQKNGAYWSTDKLPEDGEVTLLIGEGVATILTGKQATGKVGIAALSCNNIKAVALLFRERYPQAVIVIISDVGNGEQAALEAARAVDGWLVKPTFQEGSTGTDINDLMIESGLQAVKDCIQAAREVDPLEEPSPDADATTDEWPEPLLFGEIDTPEITSDNLPEPLASFCKAVSESTQTPPGMAVMMALATVSTCLQKRFEVCPFNDGYTEPVNIMPIVGAEPATRKSAIVKTLTEPLSIWETEQADQLKDAILQTRHARDMAIKTIESIKSTASKPGATDADRREALTEIKRLEDAMPPEVIPPRLWTDDVTLERLQNMMADQGERMAVISAEGGFFEVAAGLYSGGKSNVNIVLQGHAGEPVRVERQGRSVMMLKPALTFGLMVQPSIIADLASGNKARFRGNGMLARLLYCLPKSTVGTRDVTKRRPVSKEISAKHHGLIYRLLAIPPLSDESGRERPRILTLAPDALSAWLTFSQYIESKQGLYGEFHCIQDWTGKLPGAALRIAGLCHVIEHGESSTVISRHIIEKVLDLAELLIVHAKAAFDMMGTDPAIPDAKFLLQWIIKNGTDSFRRGDLHKAVHGKFQRVDRLISALRVLTERHIISEPFNKPTGRRPEITYMVNPAVLKGGN